MESFVSSYLVSAIVFFEYFVKTIVISWDFWFLQKFEFLDRNRMLGYCQYVF